MMRDKSAQPEEGTSGWKLAEKASADLLDVTRSVSELHPLLGMELEHDTGHPGRYLCGWVAANDAFFNSTSLSFSFEDVTGYLVKIVVYGLDDPELSLEEQQRSLTSRFSKGRPILIVEPYLKVEVDGSESVHIEQPDRIGPWEGVPTDLASWRKLGDDFFSVLSSRNEGRGALECYQRALQTVQPELHTLAILLNNLATCRFKVGDFATAVQLSGAAVHLNPAYFKGWFRLASSSAAIETKSAKGEDHLKFESLTSRVVAQAHRALPSMAPKEQDLLNTALKKGVSLCTIAESSALVHRQLHSLAQWCAGLASPGFVLSVKGLPSATKSADKWRQEGSAHFIKKNFNAAEGCYRNGLVAIQSCCMDVSHVLNNIAAVMILMRHREAGDIAENPFEDGVSTLETALLNSTVAGIIDPLNYKAWIRRAHCLESLEFSVDECTMDLQATRSNIFSIVLMHQESNARVEEFTHAISIEIQHRLQHPKYTTDALSALDVSTDVQRKERDALRRDIPAPVGSRGSLSEQKMPTRSNMLQEEIRGISGSSVYDSLMQNALPGSQPNIQDQMPSRNMLMFLTNLPHQIHTDFPKLRGWPSGINPSVAQKMLYRAYLDACVHPWLTAEGLSNGAYFEKMDRADLVKRWRGTAAIKLIQAKGILESGDIIDGRELFTGQEPAYAYDTRIRLNFANNPNRSEIYYTGTTHVAIGFNDFSSLLAATIEQAKTRKPLRYVGFEMSTFSVAKCKVVAEMLRSSTVPISSVMEVWLSSTWSEDTMRDFRSSTSTVLQTLGPDENCKVRAYLEHWTSAKAVSAAKARSDFCSNVEKYNQKGLPALFCFRREIEGLDLTQYMITGEIRASASVATLVEQERGDDSSATPMEKNDKVLNEAVAPSFGSLTMWSVPSWAPPAEEESAFNTVDFMKILEDFKKREREHKTSTDRLSVVDLFEIHMMKNLHRVRVLLLAKKLTIEVNHGVVKAVQAGTVNDPVNQELLARIAMMRPRTMSWSNVLDYFLPEDIHDLARRCSDVWHV